MIDLEPSRASVGRVRRGVHGWWYLQANNLGNSKGGGGRLQACRLQGCTVAWTGPVPWLIGWLRVCPWPVARGSRQPLLFPGYFLTRHRSTSAASHTLISLSPPCCLSACLATSPVWPLAWAFLSASLRPLPRLFAGLEKEKIWMARSVGGKCEPGGKALQ